MQELKRLSKKRMKKYYHATYPDAMEQIIADGILKKGWDDCVYLCETPQEAARFVAIRGYKTVYVIEIILPEDKVKESFDHSIQFFQCRAYTYKGNIKIEPEAMVTRYCFD